MGFLGAVGFGFSPLAFITTALASLSAFVIGSSINCALVTIVLWVFSSAFTIWSLGPHLLRARLSVASDSVIAAALVAASISSDTKGSLVGAFFFSTFADLIFFSSSPITSSRSFAISGGNLTFGFSMSLAICPLSFLTNFSRAPSLLNVPSLIAERIASVFVFCALITSTVRPVGTGFPVISRPVLFSGLRVEALMGGFIVGTFSNAESSTLNLFLRVVRVIVSAFTASLPLTHT